MTATANRPAVEIRRWRMTRGRLWNCPGPAWFWRYDADLPDGRQLRGIERIADIRSMIRRAGCTPAESWKGKQS